MRTRVVEALGLYHRPVAGLFGMLVTVALGLNLLFLTHKFLGVPEYAGFGFEEERGIPAVVMFVFTAWAAGLAAYLAVAHRQAALAGWSVLFAALLADDFFKVHERMAKVVSANLPVPHPYGHQVGEIVWLAFAGSALLAVIAIGYRFATPEWRAASRVLLGLLALLALCGVGIDAVHGFVRAFTGTRGTWHVIMGSLEDGGEILTIGVFVAFLYALAFCGHRSTPETLTRRAFRGRRATPARHATRA